jgi:two-component system, NarL family, response regulator
VNGSRPSIGATRLVGMSAMERGILGDAAAGLTMAESATRRTKGIETVKSQRRQILLKLGARNMTHAVAIALRDGLIESPRGGS